MSFESVQDTDRLGHKYMKSYVQNKPRKYSSKSLPLSIANILGHLDSENENEHKSQEQKTPESHSTVASEDMQSEVDIESEISNKFEAENEDSQVKMSIEDSSPQEKQSPSYTAIIAQAILSAPDKKLPLGSIYDYIAEHFPEFLKKGQGWRNCVRHNLSLSECFIKAGRARNGRGNYWGIHPRYLKNFSKGDFRKRRASHRPRNRDLAMGLSAERLHYSHFLNPFLLPATHHVPGQHRSFTVESLLSPERGYSAFDSYRPRLTKVEATRMPGVCASSIPSWLEHKPVHHTNYHGFLDRDMAVQTPCSCNSFCWTRA